MIQEKQPTTIEITAIDCANRGGNLGMFAMTICTAGAAFLLIPEADPQVKTGIVAFSALIGALGGRYIGAVLGILVEKQFYN